MITLTSLRALLGAGRGPLGKYPAAALAARFTLLAALCCLPSSAADAQTERPGPPAPPGPPLPPGQPELADQTDPTTGTSRVPSSWSYSLGLSEGYESDVRFNGDAGNGDWNTGLDGSLSRDLRLARGGVALSGSASQLFYRRNPGQNRFMYGVAAGLSYELTRRLVWRVSESLTRSYSEDSRILTTAGQFFPRVLTETNVAGTGLTYQVSPKTTVEGSLSGTTVKFPASEFSNGSSLSVRANIARQVSRSQSLGISIGNTFSTGTTGDVQGLLGTWQMTRGRSLTLSATFGVRPYTLFGVPGRRYAPGGSFGLATALGRNQTFSASYERAVEQAFGFDRTHEAHRVNASYDFALGRRVVLQGSGSYGLNTYPQIANLTLSGYTTMAGLQCRLWRQLSLTGRYGLWVRQETGIPSTSTYRTTFSLTYGGLGR